MIHSRIGRAYNKRTSEEHSSCALNLSFLFSIIFISIILSSLVVAKPQYCNPDIPGSTCGTGTISSSSVSVPTTLCEQGDVNCGTPLDAQCIAWNDTQSKWTPQTVSAFTMPEYLNVSGVNTTRIVCSDDSGICVIRPKVDGTGYIDFTKYIEVQAQKYTGSGADLTGIARPSGIYQVQYMDAPNSITGTDAFTLSSSGKLLSVKGEGFNFTNDAEGQYPTSLWWDNSTFPQRTGMTFHDDASSNWLNAYFCSYDNIFLFGYCKFLNHNGGRNYTYGGTGILIDDAESSTGTIGIGDGVIVTSGGVVESYIAPTDLCLSNGTNCPVATITYLKPSSINTKYGTPTGNISDVQYYDSLTYNITESAGANPLQVFINFTGVTTFGELELRERYSGVNGHSIYVELWDYNSNSYQSYGEITDQAVMSWMAIPVLDFQNHVSGGLVSLRLTHQGTGVATHFFDIDYVALKDSNSTGISEHDGLSGRDSISNHPWAMDTEGTRNISSLKVTNNISAPVYYGAATYMTDFPIRSFTDYRYVGYNTTAALNQYYAVAYLGGTLQTSQVSGNVTICIADFPRRAGTISSISLVVSTGIAVSNFSYWVAVYNNTNQSYAYPDKLVAQSSYFIKPNATSTLQFPVSATLKNDLYWYCWYESDGRSGETTPTTRGITAQFNPTGIKVLPAGILQTYGYTYVNNSFDGNFPTKFPETAPFYTTSTSPFILVKYAD